MLRISSHSKIKPSQNFKNLVKWDLNKITGIGTISLNAPKKMNALSGQMGDEFTNLLKTEIYHKSPSELKALIITGSGSRAFSAGGDLAFLQDRNKDSPYNNSIIMREFYQKFLNVRKYCPVPTIAAINGHAIGAGFSLALACDIRIAHPNAKMGVTFVGLGLSPGMGTTHFLPSVAGPEVANELIFTGKTVSGDEAVKMRLVSKIDEDCLNSAIKLAENISLQGPLAVRAAVRASRISQDNYGDGLESALRREADAQGNVYNSLDLKEGVDALIEKRKPVFRGE